MSQDFFSKYSFKVKTIKSIKPLLKKFPRNKKVILCHGVFDLLHIGHIKHFESANTMPLAYLSSSILN